MKIVLEFPGFLQAGTLQSGETLELDAGTTVSQLLNSLGVSEDHQRHITPIINQEESRAEIELQPGDHLFLYIPVGGG